MLPARPGLPEKSYQATSAGPAGDGIAPVESSPRAVTGATTPIRGTSSRTIQRWTSFREESAGAAPAGGSDVGASGLDERTRACGARSPSTISRPKVAKARPMTRNAVASELRVINGLPFPAAQRGARLGDRGRAAGSDSFDLVIVRKEGPRMGVSLMWAGGIGWPGVRGCGNSLADSCKG